MNRIFVGVFAIASLVLASGAAAQVTGSVGYSHVDEDISVGAVQGTIGYRFPALQGQAGSGYFIPELRAGFGVDDDTFLGTKVELDDYYGVATRYQYEAAGGFYGFVQGSYVNYRFEASAMGVSVSDSSWEFGAGLGAGVVFTPQWGAELSWERVDSADVFNVSVRFGF